MESLDSVFKYLADVSFNFWLPLLFVAAPALLFFVTPQKHPLLRLSRLIVAVILTYGLLSLHFGTEHFIAYRKYKACAAGVGEPNLYYKFNEQCRYYVDNHNHPAEAFAIFLGWIPAIAYVGFWELLWRLHHRKIIKEMGRGYHGKWFSNLTVVFSIFCGFYILTMFNLWLTVVAYDYVYPSGPYSLSGIIEEYLSTTDYP